MVYPGQTFDVALGIDRQAGTITQAALEATVESFHRRNEEARLIEARSQEPMVRGIRLKAVGLVDHPEFGRREAGSMPEPISRRRVHTGGDWHDDVPVYDGEALPAGPEIKGPAIIQSRFTTLVLRPGDEAVVLPSGDTLVQVGAPAGSDTARAG
jgi:N-methylhydantoinase A